MWGRRIGAVAIEEGAAFASFQYDPAFAGSGIEVAPLTMPLSENDRGQIILDRFPHDVRVNVIVLKDQEISQPHQADLPCMPRHAT